MTIVKHSNLPATNLKEFKMVAQEASLPIEGLSGVSKTPWWGGFFERLVRSVTRCLKKVIGHSRLSYDDLSTLVVEIKGTLNS